MRNLFFVFSLLSSNFAFGNPLDCYQAASQDRVIKWSDDLKTSLCRKATSLAPYECFAHAYTNNPDYKIISTMAIVLCQGATDAQAPLNCFEKAIQRYRGMNYGIAIKFCSGALSAEKAMDCFDQAKAKFQLGNELAANLCAQ